MLTISNTAIEDLDIIRELYSLAIQYQKSKSEIYWHGMDHALIEKEIKNQLHWKIVEDDQITCFFSVAFTDRLVWDERDADPSIYLHRIVTNPAFRGRGYVKNIVAWAEQFGRASGKHFVRLDTHKDNQRLNAYYLECGFVYCGIKKFDSEDNNPAIPKHYRGNGLSLYERRIPAKPLS